MYISLCSNYPNAANYVVNNNYILINKQKIKILLLIDLNTDVVLLSLIKKIPNNIIDYLNMKLKTGRLYITPTMIENILMFNIKQIEQDAFTSLRQNSENIIDLINDTRSGSYSCCIISGSSLIVTQTKNFTWSLYSNYTCVAESTETSYVLGYLTSKITNTNGIYFYVEPTNYPEIVILHIDENKTFVMHSNTIKNLSPYDIIREDTFRISKEIVDLYSEDKVVFAHIRF